jgi:hypothetical protein
MEAVYRKTFHDTVIRLLDFIRDEVKENSPEIKKKIIAYKGMYRYITNSDMPLRYFHIYTEPHRNDIANRNDTFIKDLDLQKMVSETTKAASADDALEDTKFLRDAWTTGTLSDVAKDGIWKFMAVLMKVSDKYNHSCPLKN